MRVGPEGAFGLGEAAGAGGGESCGVGVALGVDTGGTFVEGLWRRSLGFGVDRVSERGVFSFVFGEEERCRLAG